MENSTNQSIKIQCSLLKKKVIYFYHIIDIKYRTITSLGYNIPDILNVKCFNMIESNYFCKQNADYLNLTKTRYINTIQQIFYDFDDLVNTSVDLDLLFTNKKYKYINPRHVHQIYNKYPTNYLTKLNNILIKLDKCTYQIKLNIESVMNKHMIDLINNKSDPISNSIVNPDSSELNKYIGKLILDTCNYLIDINIYTINNIIYQIFEPFIMSNESDNPLLIL